MSSVSTNDFHSYTSNSLDQAVYAHTCLLLALVRPALLTRDAVLTTSGSSASNFCKRANAKGALLFANLWLALLKSGINPDITRGGLLLHPRRRVATHPAQPPPLLPRQNIRLDHRPLSHLTPHPPLGLHLNQKRNRLEQLPVVRGLLAYGYLRGPKWRH